MSDTPYIPASITVHLGPPGSDAENVTVSFPDYIKNVACCEIYSTWSESTIEANILAIMSFTLNRVYTEWYRNKGYNFTITSSTAYDHKWIYGKTIYENISQIADRLYKCQAADSHTILRWQARLLSKLDDTVGF